MQVSHYAGAFINAAWCEVEGSGTGSEKELTQRTQLELQTASSWSSESVSEYQSVSESRWFHIFLHLVLITGTQKTYRWGPNIICAI